MIRTREDLKYYLEECRKAYGKDDKWNLRGWLLSILFPDNNYMFMRNLCYYEYWHNKCIARKGGVIAGILRIFYARRHGKLRVKTGIELTVNCAGPGLHVSHGKIVVSGIARIGTHCKILSDVTIGGQGRYDIDGAPILGNRIWIGSGAKIIGPIHIADGVVIGANAVVTKSIEEPNTTWGGMPARKLSDNGSNMFLRESFRV